MKILAFTAASILLLTGLKFVIKGGNEKRLIVLLTGIVAIVLSAITFAAALAFLK